MKRGYFISFEGVDGCGKGTQIEKLKAYFEEKKADVLYTREPGGNVVAEKIRTILHDPENEINDTAEMLLYAAARALVTETIIEPALESGKIVVCDRFIDSSVTFQGYGRGLGADLVLSVNKIATRGLMPDLTILLDLDGAAGLARNQGIEGKLDRMEMEGEWLQNKVRAGYLELAENDPERFLVIDATKTREEIFEIIKAEIEKRGVIEC
ncbi:MAG: dTMP kinase [Clostridia bacterium]|nr:dTMP kinase [Clostridia bacterium]